MTDVTSALQDACHLCKAERRPPLSPEPTLSGIRRGLSMSWGWRGSAGSGRSPEAAAELGDAWSRLLVAGVAGERYVEVQAVRSKGSRPSQVTGRVSISTVVRLQARFAATAAAQSVQLLDCGDSAAADGAQVALVDAVHSLLIGKLEKCVGEAESYQVTPDLYSLWAATSAVDTELFADALNESGTLGAYCSVDVMDKAFGSCGTWQEAEGNVLGGCGNPPFSMTGEVLRACERGVRGKEPYCRLLLLPWTEQGPLSALAADPLFGGHVLVRIPGGSLGFRRQKHLLNAKRLASRPQPHWKLRLALVAWANDAYLSQRPPALDVEIAYAGWVLRACRRPERCVLHLRAFQRAFPLASRSTAEVGPLFDAS